MVGYTGRMVDELVCLHKQVTEWTTCPHHPNHEDLADAVIRFLRTQDPVTRRAIRAATAGRRNR
jgi:hypothetical protein